jgi:hypothetical protein
MEARHMVHKRNFAVVLILVIALLIYLHRSPNESELIGTYVDNSNFPAKQLELLPGGHFTNYAARGRSTGNWKFKEWVLYEDDLILTSDDKGLQSYADQYLLTRKRGVPCIEPEGDDGDAYWCKVAK